MLTSNGKSSGGTFRMIRCSHIVLVLLLPCIGFAQTPTETPEPSPSVSPAPSLTPLPCFNVLESLETASPPASPTAIPAPVNYLETMFGSAGSRWPLKPLEDTADISPTFGLAPIYNSTLPGDENYRESNSEFSVEIIQSAYNWELYDNSQKGEFANHTMQFLAASHAALANLASGEGLTRSSSVPVSQERQDQKYVIGTVALAGSLRGGTTMGDGKFSYGVDTWNAVGSAIFTSLGFDFSQLGSPGNQDDISFENGHDGDERYAQYHMKEVIALRSIAGIGRSIAAFDETGILLGPTDARLQARKEDDIYDIAPAIVDSLIGTESTVYIDNNKNDNITGKLGCASPIWLNFITLAKQSWINVNKLRGIQVNFYCADNALTCAGTNQREGSKVENYVGVEISAPDNVPSGLINSAIGLKIGDGKHYSMPPQLATLVDKSLDEANMAAIPERKVAILAHGNVIVGDPDSSGSFRKSGYDTSILDVNGAVHMSPRMGPPAFDRRVAPSHRAGLVYFDVQRNALRVSVAAPVSAVGGEKQGSADWRQTEVAWVDVGLDTESIVPSRDIAGGPKEPGRAAFSLAAATRVTVIESLESARTLAVSGESPYLRPRVRVLPPPDPLNVAQSEYPTIFLTSGFDGVPRIFWRRKDLAATQWPDATSWCEVDFDAIQSAGGFSHPDTAFSAIINYAQMEDSDLPPRYGQLVELLLIDRTTSQAAGASFTIGSTQ